MAMTTILAILAVWRLSNMVEGEAGPFEVFEKLRSWSWSLGDWVGDGMHCIWCLSFWIAGIASAFACAMDLIPLVLVPFWWPAVSAGAILFNGLLKKYFT